MRWKAEQAIRQAAAELGDLPQFGLDKIRIGAGLHRKVFDKTILDMARVGTIRLFGKEASEMMGQDIADMVQQGTIVYLSFAFLDIQQYDPVCGKVPT
jgi:hypothetical protein